MTEILNPLYSKRKYVESIIQRNANFQDEDDNFLKPVDSSRELKVVIIEDGYTLQSRKVPIDDSTLPEVQRLLNLMESREWSSESETSTYPDWAKLALASTNPNRRRKIDYY